MTSTIRLLFIVFLALAAGACAALQPPDANGPRPNEPVYPVLLKEDAQRHDAALAAATHLLAASGKPDIRLRPITGTIESLAQSPNAPYLPKVGTSEPMKEEETRESLRRFINDWRGPIGCEPSHLSLAERTHEANGVEAAVYEQRPFRYPLRGDYGKLQIRFTTNRRVLDVSSTCIPEAERLQTALANVMPQLSPEEAVKYLLDNGVTYTDASGKLQTFRPSASTPPSARELVVFVTRAQAGNALELHLAWEISLAGNSVQTAYLDAVKNEVIAAR